MIKVTFCIRWMKMMDILMSAGGDKWLAIWREKNHYIQTARRI